MLKQEYSSNSLKRVIRKRDIIKWGLWKNNSDKQKKIQKIADEINKDDYCIKKLKEEIREGITVYHEDNKFDFLALKQVNFYLKRIYKVNQSDRSRIVSQVKTMLADGGDYKLLKLDISSFYSSISMSKIIDKIENDMILSYKGLQLLKHLNSVMKSEGIDGLPMGISVSASLSELLARDIDSRMRRLRGVIYYTRYVDDILIFYDETIINDIEKRFERALDKLGHNLKINTQKTYPGDTRNAEFDYLGYSFKTIYNKKKRCNYVIVKVATKKINKIKRRIAKSFVQYASKKDLQLLIDRLLYLSSVKILDESESGVLYAGNTYNYQEITEKNAFKCLDGYMCAILDGKIKIKGLSFTIAEKTRLRKISFHWGYNECKKVKYNTIRATEIIKIWKYD